MRREMTRTLLHDFLLRQLQSADLHQMISAELCILTFRMLFALSERKVCKLDKSQRNKWLSKTSSDLTLWFRLIKCFKEAVLSRNTDSLNILRLESAHQKTYKQLGKAGGTWQRCLQFIREETKQHELEEAHTPFSNSFYALHLWWLFLLCLYFHTLNKHRIYERTTLHIINAAQHF